MRLLTEILGLWTIPVAAAQSVNPQEIASQTENQLTSLVSFIINQIPLWITAFIVIVLTFFVARIVKSSVENKMATQGFDEEHKEMAILASRTANAAVLVIGITVGLKIAGIDLTAIIAAGAFGVGFALRDIIMNFIAGVMILSSRHYSIGDVIKVKGTMGKIVEIQTRATVLKAFDGTRIVVPNADLFKNQVVSFTSNPFRRIKLVNGVNYGEDLQKVMQVVENAIKSTKGILLEPKPKISFFEWGPYSVNFNITAWVESRSAWIKTRNDLILNINKAMRSAGITIPYPIQTVALSEEEQKLEAMVTTPETPATPQWLQKAATTPGTQAKEPSSPLPEGPSIPPTEPETQPAAQSTPEPTPQPTPRPGAPAEGQPPPPVPNEPQSQLTPAPQAAAPNTLSMPPAKNEDGQ